MATDIKELVKRLRNWNLVGDAVDLRKKAADALEALAGEVERLTLNGTHSCHDDCQRLPCIQGREIRALAAERDRLEAALEGIARNAETATDLPLFRVQCRDFARKALGDAS